MSNYQQITDGSVTFSIEASNTLYYANAVNSMGFIEKLSVSSSSVLNDVTLDVRFVAAAGQISLPFSIEIATLGNGEITKRHLPISFDPNLMLQIVDAQAGTIAVEVKNGDTTMAKAQWPITILPSNFWMVGNTVQDYHALAAFVQPQHPSIRKVLEDAVDELKAMGEPPSLSGYQDLGHVDKLVEAAFRALKKRQITYSDPPSTWQVTGGQKIRTPQEVLDEGIGTCLDTAVFFASCLETMGLDPILVIVKEHAFVGYWTAESRVAAEGESFGILPGLTAIESVGNLIDAGYIRFFETTDVCQHSTSSFTEAIASSRFRLESAQAFGVNASTSYLLNIRQYRYSSVQILPMPARFVLPDGTAQVVEYKPEVVDLAALRDAVTQKDGITGNTIRLDVPANVKKWLDSLLDLSLRNPLINLKENRRNTLKLLVPKGQLGTLENLLQMDKTFALAPGFSNGSGQLADASTDRGEATVAAEDLLGNQFAQQIIHVNTSPEILQRSLRKLAAEAKLFIEETGSNGLYLALGTLSWKIDKPEIRSPLLLVPIALTGRNRNREFTFSLEESGVTPNFSLVEKLKIEHKLNLSGLENIMTDQHGVDVDGTFEYVRHELAKAGLNDFRVDETATIGLFNFSSFRLWKDLLENWQKFERNPLVKHLIHTPNEAFAEPSELAPTEDLDSLIAELPVSSDGSQARAVAMSAAAKTFILQGPPGTGKSQTITNILAKALDDGKRVLFVAEKKDALDVVKQRMDASGIGAFSLDLHDKGSTSRAVRAQLDEVIDILVDPDTTGYEAALQDYEAALGPLKRYRSQLHEVGPLGESVYSAKDKFLAQSGDHELPITGEFVSKATVEIKGELLDAAKSFANLGGDGNISGVSVWSLVDASVAAEQEKLKQIGQMARVLFDSFENLKNRASLISLLEKVENLDEVSVWQALSEGSYTQAALEFTASNTGLEHIAYVAESLSKLAAAIVNIGHNVDGLAIVDLQSLRLAAQEAQTSSSLLRGGKLKKVHKQLERLLGVTVPVAPSDINQHLERLVNLNTTAIAARTELERISGLRLDADLNLLSSIGVQTASLATENLRKLGSFAASKIDSNSVVNLLASLSTEDRKIAATFAENLDSFRQEARSSKESELLWQGGQKLVDRLSLSIPKWRQDAVEYAFAPLLRWTTAAAALQPFYKYNLADAADSLLSGKVPHTAAANAFLKGFYKRVFENLLVIQGLNTFDGSSIGNFIRKLEEAHENLRVRIPKVLGAELLSRRGFDSSMKIGAIGDLILAVKAGRNTMPLRTLLSRHWEVISRITPCVLASPDSAVRFIDPNFEAFDLVVFDEASQIKVANSIGALGRAKSAIVVGDTEQMPPTSVAQSGSLLEQDSEEDEDLYLGEPESILAACGNARMPEVMLTWHYRSEDESLIAFSNNAYYKSQLSTFPTPRISGSEKMVKFKYLEQGEFLRDTSDVRSSRFASVDGAQRTNPVEANAIVAEVISRLENPTTSNNSLGIVTFNVQQRNLIKSLLENSDNPLLIKAMQDGVGGEEIFVKNLESVQGSERDVILFSIAFSAKKAPNGAKGSLPLNFGPIGKSGGHKRLNVAITRARCEVVIFCSFLPGELLSREPSSRGLQDLGNYLAMAYENGTSSLAAEAVKEERLDRHRVEVANALREAGLPVVEEVGLSDFKVDIAILGASGSGAAVLGILLDGKRWHERNTVMDRDVLPVSLLTSRMGWARIERIWLPNWLRDPGAEVARIRAAYETALTTPISRTSKVIAAQEPVFTKKSAEQSSEVLSLNPIDQLMARTRIWQPVQSQAMHAQNHLDHLHVPAVRDEIFRLAQFITEHEGPVSKKRLGGFIAQCFGYGRVASQRAEDIHEVTRSRLQTDREGFIYPQGVAVVDYLEWRIAPPGAVRPAAEISLPEISNAMKDICMAAGGVRVDQLLKETTKVFGIQKVSAQTLERFRFALEWGVANGRLSISGDYVTAMSA